MHSSRWCAACVPGPLRRFVCGCRWCKREAHGVWLLGQAHESSGCDWKLHGLELIKHKNMLLKG